MTPPEAQSMDDGAQVFSADWLRLREPFDTRARDAAAVRLKLAQRLAGLRVHANEPWRVIDLGCGTGTNARWLAPRLGGPQQWLALDRDAALLQHWPPDTLPHKRATSGLDTPLQLSGADFVATVMRRRLDLARRLHELPWQHVHLVSASALLDLAGTPWLQQLVRLAAAARVALLLALNVDGRHGWQPGDRDDGFVAALFAIHQRRDKGLGGPALGPAAVTWLRRALRAAAFQVHSARSDWLLDAQRDPPAAQLLLQLINGIADAAAEQDPRAAARVRRWQQRRQASAAATVLQVGHQDLLALPAR